MIPHSRFSDEIFENELRNRVSDCRKRVRRNRAMQKLAPDRNLSERILPEPVSAGFESDSYTDQFEVGERSVEEQEVRIT